MKFAKWLTHRFERQLKKKLTDSMHMITYAGLGLLIIVIGYAVVRTVLFITKINTFGF
jgi:hypothetical protein